MSEVIAVWVQALAAVASLALTAWLIWYSHRGWQAADRNAAAAEKSADAAKRSADVAEQALTLTQRGFLSIGNWRQTGDFAEGVKPVVRFTMTNQGNTPITLIETNIVRRIGPTLPDPVVYGKTITEHHGYTLAAKQPFDINMSELPPMTKEEAEAITNGATRVWVYGYTTYRDSFPNTEVHTVGYVARFDAQDKCLYVEHVPGYQRND